MGGAFNSLSRDHSPPRLAGARTSGRFQLPLSGSLEARKQAIDEELTFNSLSRDHPVIAGDHVAVPAAFNSLSRDHIEGIERGIEDWSRLSTPSLGITGYFWVSITNRVPLSTPSLGITSVGANELHPHKILTLSTPSLGITTIWLSWSASTTSYRLSTPSLGITITWALVVIG